MSDVKWIKIVSDIFDDEKILLIESLPKADSIIVIWFKLLCLAGKNNNSGVFLIGDKVPYTDEMLATIFRRDIKTVRLAMKAFEEYGMVEVIDGVYTLPNWGKHQSLEKIENRASYMKNYMSEYREKQKKKAECKQICKPNSKVNNDVNKEVNSDVNSKLNESFNSVNNKANSKPNSKHDVNCTEEDIYKEELDKEKDIKNIAHDEMRNAQELFEKLWKSYPCKKGKGHVSDKQKRKLLAIGEQELLRAIERYKSELKKDEDWRRMQYGSTFFNSGYVDYLDANFVPQEKRTGTPSRFNNFSQRDYDFGDLERRLLGQPQNMPKGVDST